MNTAEEGFKFERTLVRVTSGSLSILKHDETKTYLS
jgi:hypothetical protein